MGTSGVTVWKESQILLGILLAKVCLVQKVIGLCLAES